MAARSSAWWLLLGLAAAGCAHGGTATEAAVEDKFYKSAYVRRCLQYEKEHLFSEAQACWERLLARLEREPGFREKSGLSKADLKRIQRLAGRARKRQKRRQDELRSCIEIARRTRAERIACFERYLSRYGDNLTRSQRFEIEANIAALRRAERRARGEVEDTLEHAGKLLGLELAMEEEGVRIEAVRAPPATSAGLREQGLVVLIDDQRVAAMDTAERIARLESCREGALELLVRYGELGSVGFIRARLACAQPPRGQRLGEVQLPEEACTEAGDPELALGLSWCYLGRDGILEVEQVCVGSPAARAGVRPGQRYHAIGERRLLGLTRLQIAELVKNFPTRPLRLHAVGGVLESPQPVTGPALDEAGRRHCWQAISTTLERGHTTE